MKKTLKSILSLVLAFVLVFSLAACNDKKDDEEETKAEVEEETTLADNSEKDENDLLGYSVGKTYYNDYAGFSIEIGDEWEFYNEEQIEKLNGVAMDLVSDDLANAIEAAGVLYAMYAQDPNTAHNINVTVEPSVVNINAETRAQLQAEQLPAVYEDMGATDVTVEATVTTIDGKDFHTCDSECNIYGLTMYQKVIMIDTEDYLFGIALTALDKAGIDEIVKGISLE